jgi:hypothetical protein
MKTSVSLCPRNISLNWRKHFSDDTSMEEFDVDGSRNGSSGNFKLTSRHARNGLSRQSTTFVQNAGKVRKHASAGEFDGYI